MKSGPPATDKIGVIYPFPEEGFNQEVFYRTLLSGVQSQADKWGKKLVQCSLFQYKENGIYSRAFEEMRHQVDGLIVLTLYPEIYLKIEKILRDPPWPLVMLYYEAMVDDIDTVTVDNYANTRSMTDFLLSLGHTRIVFALRPISVLDQNESSGAYSIRAKAYQDVMREHGLKPELMNISTSDRSIVEQINLLNHQPDPPTALFCFDDDLALRIYKVLPFLKIRVPQDLTVVGYDGVPDGLKAVPPLTTLQTPLFEMGVRSVERLLEKIKEQEKGTITHRKIVLPGIIVERGSHRRWQ
jgi:DNA-binding LacI/PurR family transcriptional regulator